MLTAAVPNIEISTVLFFIMFLIYSPGDTNVYGGEFEGIGRGHCRG